MPFYPAIENLKEKKRVYERLLKLRQQLDAEIPERSHQESLLLASWNIREFDSSAYGERMPEAFYYIAEIMDRFDLVAVQEVRKDLKAVETLSNILGSNWHYTFTDVTEGSAGNKERLAFFYDSRKVHFGGLAGELVLPPAKTKKGEKPIAVDQLARSPYIVGFRAGWTRFMLATVHILYGKSTANDPARVREIRELAKFLKQRTQDDSAWAKNLILLGDFNIFNPKDETMKALTDKKYGGFVIPPELQNLPSNAPRTKYYDQIAFRVRKDRLNTTGRAGVFNFYESVFTLDDEKEYVDAMGERYHTTSGGKKRSSPTQYYKTYWRTHQMSDHLPMWVELKINYTDAYLKRKLKAASK